jgi:hypothetical protein
MELTPEERRRVYEEEKARLEAGQKLPQVPQQKKGITGNVILIIGVLLAFVVIARIGRTPSDSNESSSHTFTLSIGDTGTITSPSMMADTVEDWGTGVKAHTAHDDMGVTELIVQGRAFSVETGTSVRVIDLGHWEGFSLYRLRVLDGDNAGLAGWTGTRVVTASRAR